MANIPFLNNAYFSSKVGIGTDSPDAKLDIEGDFETTYALKFTNTKGTGNVSGFRSHGVNGEDLSLYNGANRIQRWDENGNSIFDGNVGIGTTSPDASLHVTTSASQGTFRLSPQDGTYEDYRLDIVAKAIDEGALTMKLKDNTFLKTYGYYSLTGVSHGVAGYEDLLHLKSTGNVGIGTTSPGAKLEVSDGSSGFTGNYNARTAAVFEGSNSAGTTLSIMSPDTGYSGIFFGNNTLETYGQLAFDHTSNSFKFINGGGTERMRITSDGNVGIGTTSPLALLSIGSGSLADTNVPVQISTSGGTSQRWFGVNKDGSYGLIMGYVNGGSIGDGGAGAYIRNVTNDPLYFMVGNSALAMTILANKKVGIGTASPAAKLDVINSHLSTMLRLSNTEANATIKYGAVLGRHYTNAEENVTGMLITSSSSVTGGSVSIGGGISDSNAVNEIKFYTAANNTTLTGSERMRITSTGNVGIGTTLPGTKLHISQPGGSSQLTLERTGGGAGKAVLAGAAEGLIVYDELYGAKMYVGTAGTYNGNVGIGTTSPGANLEIRGTVNTDDCKIYLKENSLYGAYFKYDGDINRGYIGGITSTTSENAVMSWSRDGSELKLVTSGSTAVTIDSNRDVTFAEDIIIKDVLLSNQANTDVDTGAEVVAQVAHATYTAAFFDFVVKKGTNVRSGTVYACHDGDTTPLVEFTETSTQDLGDTSDVVLSVDISGTQMRLIATVASDDWIVKSLIRAI